MGDLPPDRQKRDKACRPAASFDPEISYRRGMDKGCLSGVGKGRFRPMPTRRAPYASSRGIDPDTISQRSCCAKAAFRTGRRAAQDPSEPNHARWRHVRLAHWLS